MPPIPPPHLTLDNFNLPSEVPENCPFVLTSPRSLEACRRAGVQPVSLLPSTLQEYEDALPDLSREKVLAIFRELETAKEVKVTNCREFRKQITWEEEHGNGDDKDRGVTGIRQRHFDGRRVERKLSCLSPIVEHSGGRESALGTSNLGPVSTPSTSQSGSVSSTSCSQSRTVSKDKLEKESLLDQSKSETLSGLSPSQSEPGPYLDSSQPGSESPLGFRQSGRVSLERNHSPQEEKEPSQHILLPVSPPPLYVEDVNVSDQPESDQHVSFPKVSQNGLIESHGLFINAIGSDDLVINQSRESLESDFFYSDLAFSESPSPVGFQYIDQVEDWRSCPELDKDRYDSFSDLSQRDYSELSFAGNMEKKASKSAHALKPLNVNLSPDSQAYRRSPDSQAYRRTSSRSKKKASRSERLTSESLQSLYDAVEASSTGNEKCQEDDCPESERFCASNGDNINSVGCSLPLSPLSTWSTKSPWPHNKSLTGVSPGNSCLVKNALSRSEIDIDQMQISQQDLRILEILAIRNNEEAARRTKQYKLRIQWEEEKSKRELEKSELEKEYRKNLTAKRRKDDDECQRRLQQARERFIKSQEYLRQLLKEKDDRKKELVNTIIQQKEVLIREHREHEDSKRTAVDNAVKDLLNRDTQYRNVLRMQVEEKLKKAERNRQQNEINRALSLTESNRLDILQHQLRVKKLEEIYEDHVEKIKKTIEKKLRQASELLKIQRHDQHSNIRKYELSYSKTLALKAELEAGLDLWRKQVLSVQSQSIRRAEEKVRNDLESRREKLAEEMRSREQKCLEKRKEKEEEKKMRVVNAKKKIEEKEKKVQKLKIEREMSIIRARKMAETSAKLRELIKTYQ